MSLQSSIQFISRKPKFSRASLFRALRKQLSGRVQAAYVFGSYARGTADGESDLDLVFISETKTPWPERFRPFLDVLQKWAPVDLVVYTPSEWALMLKDKSAFARKLRREIVEIL